MPAPDPDAVVTEESQSPDLLDRKGNLPPFLYPRPDVGPHAYDPCQVILDDEGNIPVNIAEGSFEVTIGEVEVNPGDPHHIPEDTATVTPDTYAFGKSTLNILIVNKSTNTELLVSFDGGTNWGPIPPRGSLSIGTVVTEFDFKTASGTADFWGIASLQDT